MAKSITEVLGIKYPIIQGAMAWIADAELVAAVSNAGGAGVIAAGGRSTEWVEQEIKKARELTDKPFGVNVMLMAPNKDEIVEVICREKPAFVTLGAGNPVPFLEKFKSAGVKTVPVVPNVKLAKRIEAAGADAIADGRGLAAALLMGAAGVQMGTRFLVAEECNVHPKMKEKLLEAVDTDTIVTGLSIGGAVRGIKNKFSEDFVVLEFSGKATKEELIKRATGTNKLAAVDGDVENGMMQAGQSLLPLKKIEPVKTIIEGIVKEARETLANAGKIEL